MIVKFFNFLQLRQRSAHIEVFVLEKNQIKYNRRDGLRRNHILLHTKQFLR